MNDDWKKQEQRNRRSEWNRQMDGNRRHSVSRKGGDTSRIFGFVVVAIIAIIIIGIISNIGGSEYDVYETSYSGTSYDSSGYDSVPANEHTVPWDYKIQEMTVGDLIDGDMALEPDNQLLPNDDNYATGDKIWVLQFMTADLTTDSSNKNDVRLSSWMPIKSYRTKEAAEKDLDNVKVSVKADLDLIGVYKTEYNGKTREFAVVKLPSGHTVKQPINDERYKQFKDKKTVKVNLEEVHDFENYDLAMAKFRGWAE